MAYERGIASNTFDLFNKLTNFMTTISGWRMCSNIDGYGNSDFVYHSTGSNGRNEIYIRQKIAQPEPFINGADQYDYGNGDTGYLNFFSYLYYPENGDAYDGVSEIGSFGPRLFFWNADRYAFRWYFQNFLSQKPGGSSHVIYGDVVSKSEPPDYVEDPHGRDRRQFSQMNTGPSYQSIYKKFATNGKDKLYVAETNNANKIWKYSLARSGGGFSSSGGTTEGTLLGSPAFGSISLVYAEDRTSRTPYLYCFGRSSDECSRYNLITGTLEDVSNFYWPNRYGYNTNRQEGMASCWNGGKYIYIMRGGGPDWGRLDVATGAWMSTSIPENPEFRGINGVSNGGIGPESISDMTFVHNSVSGFEYHRIYLGVLGEDAIWCINIDPNTGKPPVSNSFWYRLSYTASRGGHEYKSQIIINRHGRMFNIPSNGSDGPKGIYEQNPIYPARSVIYADMKDSGDQDWKEIDPAYFPCRSKNYTWTQFFDGYACRVRSSIGANTEYVFVGNKDRIIVATKSYIEKNGSGTSSWTVAYMGAFNSVYEDSPYAEVANDVSAGPHRCIKIKNKIGIFDENSKYFIVGTSGPSKYKTYHPDGRTRKIGNSESIHITKTGSDFIIASLHNNYSAGAKIALDPQPVGVFLCDLEKFQVTNIAQKGTDIYMDDYNGCDDPSRQTYTISINEKSIKSFAGGAVQKNVPISLENLLFGTTESEGNHSAGEVRGKPIGMYVIGKVSGITSEQTISINDKGYLILEILSYINKYLVIGPLS